ncbi:MAG TPA: hypothetical protein VJB61_14680 [Actinomycetota bacterium]
MPPEHDDYRERQLAALRRYVTDLDVRRQHTGQARPAEERRRAAWPWLLLTLLLMAVSLAAGVAIGGRRDPAGGTGSGFAAATSTSAAASPTAAPECAEAVKRANESMSHAVKVAGALREHTEIMNRLLNGKLSAEAALKTGTPSLITGSAESAKFDVALADYKQVVDRCKLRAP